MSESKEISVTDAAARLASEDIQLIDVRTQSEWDGARIDGARHIELGEIAGRASEVNQDKPVFFYCHTGVRSAMATDAFAASGFDAYNVTGGIKAWVEAGQPVEPAGAEIVH